MAKKKYKKRQRSFTEEAKRQAQQERLAVEKSRSGKRFNPVARALLTDLVFLAVVSILDTNELIPDMVSGICTLTGVALLLIALWFQFGPKDRKGFGRGPKL